jgi:two-component sensor histidine kinase
MFDVCRKGFGRSLSFSATEVFASRNAVMPSNPVTFLERLPLLSGRPVLRHALAAGLSVGACLLRSGLDPWFPPGFPFLTFFPAVILSVFLLGRGPGTLSAVLCGVMAWYYFIPPARSFAIGPGTALALGFYVAVVVVDITLVEWMQQANHRLRRERERSHDLAEKSTRLAERNELLFRELQHRVSNNIQMVGAMLSLHRRGVDHALAKKALDDAATRVGLIGRIQRQLYDIDGKNTDIAAFLQGLVNDLAESDGRVGIRYDISVEPGITLDGDSLIPFALILAEAVANANEHGFADRTTGVIHIALSRAHDGITLRVTDDGVGLPDGFVVAGATSLGLKIALALARQLNAQFGVHPDAGGGTVSVLTIPDRPVVHPA